jgi:TolB-like protein
MRIMIDANVDHAVGELLADRGHEVDFVNRLFAPGTPDDTIDTFAKADGWIVVSHDRDFLRKIQQKRFNFSDTAASGYGRITLSGRESQQLERVRSTMELIEGYHRWALDTGHRLVITIGPSWIRFDDQILEQTLKAPQ